MTARLLVLVALVLGLASAAGAHEVRPAFLDLRETAPDTFAVLWKVPARGDLRLALDLRLPGSCAPEAEPVRSLEDAAFLERAVVRCAGGLNGREIAVEGLHATLTDVLARIAWRDGSVEVVRLTPDAPVTRVAGARGPLDVARTYLVLGVEHILLGLDHLLFVLALVLLIPDRRTLLWTITAFTVAHSLTLAGASLGWLSLPPGPVEASIALSIAFLARELVNLRPGETRLSTRLPWLVAFAFGLLHGLGFAGALAGIGLPHGDVPLALLTFNLGVEAGQLLFVAAALAVLRSLAVLAPVPERPARLAAGYAIGVVATVWLVERLGAMAGGA